MDESEPSETESASEQTFSSKEKTLLYCTPGRYDSTGGEHNSIIVLMGNKTGDVENVAINLKDSRSLAVQLLVSLFTAGDPFAEEVLELFPSDKNGDWYWPKD